MFSSKSEIVPDSALITDAKYLKWSINRGKSAFKVSLTAFPLSSVSATAKVSKFASTISAILFNKALL